MSDVGVKTGLGFAVLAGAGLLAGGVATGWEAHGFAQRAAPAEGTVQDTEIRRSGKSSSTWARVTLDGAGREVMVRAADLDVPAEPGQRVRLLVDPKDPEDVRAPTFLGLYFLPALLGGLGFVTVLGTTAGWRVFLSSGGSPARARGGMPPEALRAQVRMLLGAGRKLEAVQLLRAHSGLGLAEAKDLVDEIEREQR